ncbi:Sensor histidine kinase WalK (WalK) (PDB:4I5S) [Commensalibacter communis]|uniref:histidine kinase n=2 Tax=Commensalibacter communis TaxID=2972786 RepID=A0A9W4TSS6_9PROT|nr:Sensor histidine kinase WalK (WalK) (PDB:4I5S) [Commensalibacter communis]CAI3956124.1 Sensor histidine kinase WalK (WalK) (PDB:4I5S) [Commensalibacter communis]CAI3956212.1 Sensor histidine kinase WalK (WalK) (PDB:4I5S) [Commensalibacter communis]CAI3956515.1 Sensor histidine kinase WalK (WalK) (PDB:4I5S) [Commensalibacter communis]CAI3957150.1 Sensor histidine kinase WalK (WalK) (PDB:4I5S) [Commensalibacter communis]
MRLMFNNIEFDVLFVFMLGTIIGLCICLIFQKISKNISSVKEQSLIQDSTKEFFGALDDLKNIIDHISLPILVISHQTAPISASLRNQFKEHFKYFTNNIAYDLNIYAYNHYNDVFLDILRHPLFIQTLESQSNGSVVEIEIQFELPKFYYFKLVFHSFDRPETLENIVLITIIDQSQLISFNQMRTDFIAHASHELRTPLTSLDGFVQTLLTMDNTEPEMQRRFLDIMQMQVGRMIRLTNGLLALSRVERDEYRLIKEQVNLKEVLKQILEEARFKIKDKTVDLEYKDSVEGQDVEIDAEKDQLFQIFHNLLENAMRYAPLGDNQDAKVICEIAFSEDRIKWPGLGWVVSIKDNGPGIEKNHIPRLTERFYRADDKNGGTGLGLAIVKHLVTRHKGSMIIESQLGKGSCFSIWFPMHYT